MRECIIYSITIYVLLTMFILLQRPQVLNDENGQLKSWNYLKSKLKYGFISIEELICLPTLIIFISIFSYIIAQRVIR
jgi:hypothetical protein